MDFLRKLSEIEKFCNRLGDVIKYERQVFAAELEERLRLGLHGDDAINHFNDWMIRYGLSDMIV